MIFSIRQVVPPYRFSIVGPEELKLQIISMVDASTRVLNALVGTAGIQGIQGLQGLKGDIGVQGERGPTGSGTANYLEYSPPGAQATWLIVHSFSRYPAVTITDNVGNQVYADTTHLSINVLSITFPSAFMGRASLSA